MRGLRWSSAWDSWGACSVAVGNALPALKKEANVVLTSPNGAGVTELMLALIERDEPPPSAWSQA